MCGWGLAKGFVDKNEDGGAWIFREVVEGIFWGNVAGKLV